MPTILSIFLVFVGGGIGCVLRYLISVLFVHTAFPKGTLVVNIVSSLMLGFLVGLLIKEMIHSNHKILLMTGLCGGFSTFSTFSLELVQLYQQGSVMMALVYAIVSLCLGVASILVGLYLAQWLVGT